MKKYLKIFFVLIIALFVTYHAYFFVLPSVTVINNTENTLEKAKVKLPDSGLDFGVLAFGTEGTIHYALEQSDGSYQYHFELEQGHVLAGECGSVKNNEINKRLKLTVNKTEVVCEF